METAMYKDRHQAIKVAIDFRPPAGGGMSGGS
jgi:hypothetical protein